MSQKEDTNDNELRVDILTELQKRNCDHILKSILSHLGLVSLYQASSASKSYSAIVEDFARSHLSKEKRSGLQQLADYLDKPEQL